MVLRRPPGSPGPGGPAVDTVLRDGPVLPGGELSGQIHLRGGGSDAHVEHIALEFLARVGTPGSAGLTDGTVVFERVTVAGGFRLHAGERRGIDFLTTVPWQTPVTALCGHSLGVVLWVRTRVALAGARDRGGLDPLAVGPLPVQEAVLGALDGLGFGRVSAGLLAGHVAGAGQELPFRQEFRLAPPPRLACAIGELGVTFLAGPKGAEIVLTAGRDGGHAAPLRHVADHDGVADTDWAAAAGAWIRELTGSGAGDGPGPAVAGPGQRSTCSG